MTDERTCPDCGGTEFYCAATTRVHLGEKAKFRCSECGYGFVTIDDAVDTGPA